MYNLYNMSGNSTYSISQAQARLPSLIKQDSFAISVHGEIKGFFLSKQRLEAMLESLELMGNPDFRAALKEYKSGKTRFNTLEELDAEMSA